MIFDKSEDNSRLLFWEMNINGLPSLHGIIMKVLGAAIVASYCSHIVLQ